MRRYVVPNPSRRNTRPVGTITDRAKRYRAQRNAPAGPRRCGFCASRQNIDIDHISGSEAQGSADNLMYLCRSCNTRKGITQARANMGTRTVQYNPQRPPTFREYVDAALVLRGDRPGNVRAAAALMRATDPQRRAEYTRRIGAARKPNPESPTYAQYAYGVSIHQRGAHDEGGAIIHATPKATRSEYARRIAAGKRRHAAEVPF